MTNCTREGRPIFDATEAAATASVGPELLPVRRRTPMSGAANVADATTPTTTVVITTSTTANRSTLRRIRRRSRAELANAAAKRVVPTPTSR